MTKLLLNGGILNGGRNRLTLDALNKLLFSNKSEVWRKKTGDWRIEKEIQIEYCLYLSLNQN